MSMADEAVAHDRKAVMALLSGYSDDWLAQTLDFLQNPLCRRTAWVGLLREELVVRPAAQAILRDMAAAREIVELMRDETVRRRFDELMNEIALERMITE